MRKLGCIALLLVGAAWPGCSCNHTAANHGDLDMGINPDAISGGDLVIVPSDVTLDLQAGDGPDAFVIKGTIKGRWLGADCGDEEDSDDVNDDDEDTAQQ